MKVVVFCLIVFLLSACYVEEPGTICKEYDSSVTVSVVLNESVDSVAYFVNGERVCFSANSKGEYIEQGVFCKEENCVKEPLQGGSRWIVDYCSLGALCDNLNLSLDEIHVLLFTEKVVDTLRFANRDGLNLEFGKFYRVYRVTDSVAANVLNGDSFVKGSCEQGICVTNHKSTFGMCRTMEVDGVERKNACTSAWISNFHENNLY